MSIALSSPVSGSAQTGFTSPTYTVTADSAPDQFGKQWAVSGVGGAGNTPNVNSPSGPFTWTFIRPKVYRPQGPLNSAGFPTTFPRNVWKIITRKGASPYSGGPSITMLMETTISVPAGIDQSDPVAIRAMLSMHLGSLTQVSAAAGDAIVLGVF